MGFFSKLQHNLKRLNNGNSRKEDNSLDYSDTKKIEYSQHMPETYQSLELPDDELVPFTEEILDTN